MQTHIYSDAYQLFLSVGFFIFQLWGAEVASKCPQIGHHPNYRENSLVTVENSQMEEAMKELETRM